MSFIVKGYEQWERNLTEKLIDLGFQANRLKNKQDYPKVIRVLALHKLLIFLSPEWIRAKTLIIIGSKNDSLIKIAKLFRKEVVSYWIGSDVLKVLEYHKQAEVSKIKLLQNKVSKHYVIASHLKDELAECGIQAELLPILSGQVYPRKTPEFPKEHAVLTYWSKQRRNFYGGNIVDQLAMEFPDLPFYILGSDGIGETQLPNLIYLNKIENIEDVFDKVTILIRITEHDGLPSMVLEMLARGRWVIFSHEFDQTCYANDLLKAKETLKLLLLKKELNLNGISFVKEKYSVSKINIDLKKAFGGIIS